jgi:hypothetical protein
MINVSSEIRIAGLFFCLYIWGLLKFKYQVVRKAQSNSTQILKSVVVNNRQALKHGENANEILRRLKIQNKKLLEQLLNLKNQLKQTRSENKRMEKHLDDWLKLKKMIIQSAWKY